MATEALDFSLPTSTAGPQWRQSATPCFSRRQSSSESDDVARTVSDPSTSRDAAEALEMNGVSQTCLDLLLPAVCRGEVDEVRTFLKTLANGGSRSDIGAAIESLKTLKARHLSEGIEDGRSEESQSFVPCESQKTAVEMFVNFVCPRSGLSLVTSAVQAAREAVVRELLAWGADPNYECRTKDMNYAECYSVGTVKYIPSEDIKSALSEAVKAPCNMCVTCATRPYRCSQCNGSTFEQERSRARIIEMLLAAGSDVTPTVWALLTRKRHHAFCLSFEPFVRHGLAEIPIECLALAVQNGFNGAADLCKQPGLCVYWSGRCVTQGVLFRALLRCGDTHRLLRLPQHTTQQKAYKALFCQVALLKLMTILPQGEPFKTDSDDRAALTFLSLLLEEGASIHGWSAAQARVACAVLTRLSVDLPLPRVIPCELQSDKRSMFYWSHGRRKFSDTLRLSNVALLCYRWFHSLSYPARTLDFSWENWFPCLLPVVYRHIITNGRSDDVFSKAVFSSTQVPWLKSTSQIPQGWRSSRDLQPHEADEPRDASAQPHEVDAQMKVSVRMCTSSGSRVPSLVAACRDVILCGLWI